MKTNTKHITLALIASILIFMTSCNQKTPVDLIVHNANIYTVDNDFSKAQAFAVKDGKFVAVGDEETIMRQYMATETIDAQGDAVYPGFTFQIEPVMDRDNYLEWNHRFWGMIRLDDAILEKNT